MEFHHNGLRRLSADVGIDLEQGYLPDDQAPPVDREKVRLMAEGRLDATSLAQVAKICAHYRPWIAAILEEQAAYTQRVLPELRRMVSETPAEGSAGPAEAGTDRGLGDAKQ